MLCLCICGWLAVSCQLLGTQASLTAGAVNALFTHNH